MNRALPPLLLLAACAPDDLPDEVALAVRVRDAFVDGRPVVWQTGALTARAVRLRPCPEDPVRLDWPMELPEDVRTLPARATPQPWTVGFDHPIGLVAPVRPRVPIGPWCQLDLVVTGTLRLTGEVEDGGAVDVEVELPSLGMPFDVPFADLEIVTAMVGTSERTRVVVRPLVLELGVEDWLAVAGPAPIAVAPGDASHDALRDALIQGATLYRDLDGDGRVGPSERDGAFVSGLVPLAR